MRSDESCLGFLEVRGFAAAAEITDAILKAAEVEIFLLNKVGGGLVAIGIRGRLDAVQEAIERGSRVARGRGIKAASLVLAKPAPEVLEMLQLGVV